jgi:hypothetical protein
MPKKKRTRKDKIQTDLKRQSPTALSRSQSPAAVTREVEHRTEDAKPTTTTFSLPEKYQSKTKVPTARQAQTVAINTSSYNYLRGDLLKTFVITTLIIGAELFIYLFIMK